MNGFLTKKLWTSLIFAAWALPVWAQTPAGDPAPVSATLDRDASFMTSPKDSTPLTPAFSGLAAAPELMAPAPAPVPSPAPAAAPPPPLMTTDPGQISAIIATPVSVAALPDVSEESVGVQSTSGFGSGMWKGTPRAVAEVLLSSAGVTTSPVLNDLARRLLMTAAVPPEGMTQSLQSLTSMRVEKLVVFGAVTDAWALAKKADAKLIDDVSAHFVVDNLLAGDGEDPCASLPNLMSTRTGVDWQKDLIVCQLRAKDTQAAQVSLDVMRAQSNHDAIFLEVADKNILGSGKTLPSQLTPLTPPLLALLRQSGIALPGEIYGHPDFALTPALLRAAAKQDVAQLGLAERAAERGLITAADLAAVYRTIVFPPDILATPLTTVETGLRLRALLFRAAEGEKDTARRIAETIKFVQSAPPELLNGAGSIATLMLGDIKPDAALADNAVKLAQIFMLGGQGDVALAWLRLAQPTPANAQDSQNLWPQFVLAGMESDSGYATDLGNWLNMALKQADPQTDISKARDDAAATLLLLDAAGFTVPEATWATVLSAFTAKHVALSPLLLERLQAASAGGRRAESVLLAIDLAGDGEISLPTTLAITRALRLAGFKPEAATFARHAVALLAKMD